MSTVARSLTTALAVALWASAPARPAAAADAPAAVPVRPVAAVVDSQLFRAEIDAYVREHARQLRETLGEQLRRELPGKVVLATTELRTRS